MKTCKKCGKIMTLIQKDILYPSLDIFKCECGYSSYRYEGEPEEKKTDKKINKQPYKEE